MDFNDYEHLKKYKNIIDFDEISEEEKKQLLMDDCLFLAQLIPENQSRNQRIDMLSDILRGIEDFKENQKILEIPVSITPLEEIKENRKTIIKTQPLEKRQAVFTIFGGVGRAMAFRKVLI